VLVQEFKRVGGIWIMKPIGSAQGKGIFLFTRLSEISEWKYDFRSRGQQGIDPKDKDGSNKDVETYIVQVGGG
jgi:tubulin polyglutamylase TTLL9